MTGHEPIIVMRMRGMKPSIVFLNDISEKADWHIYGEHASVNVGGEPIERLDLRFLVGCVVSVFAAEKKRSCGLFEACKRAGAVKVAHAGRDWVEIWTKEGVING